MIGMGADCIEHVFDSQPGFEGNIRPSSNIGPMRKDGEE
jgi:hypothetical protein